MQTENTEAFEFQQTGPERVRKAVIEAATKLFAERGIHAVSVREIAREVGVSHTLLHLYFGSKDEIVREVLQSRNGRYAAIMASPDADDAEAVAGTFRAVMNDSDWIRTVAAGLVEGIVPGRVESNRKTHDAFTTRFAEKPAREDGVDRRVLGAAINSMLMGWAVSQNSMREAAGLGDLTEDEFRDALSALVERMVRDYA